MAFAKAIKKKMIEEEQAGAEYTAQRARDVTERPKAQREAHLNELFEGALKRGEERLSGADKFERRSKASDPKFAMENLADSKRKIAEDIESKNKFKTMKERGISPENASGKANQKYNSEFKFRHKNQFEESGVSNPVRDIGAIFLAESVRPSVAGEGSDTLPEDEQKKKDEFNRKARMAQAIKKKSN